MLNLALMRTLRGVISLDNGKLTRVAPGISFNLKWSKILIFHKTIVALGNPRFIYFMLNPDKKCLAVAASDHKTRESFKVPDYSEIDEPDWEFKINSLPLISHIYECCEWNAERTYRADGVLYVDQGLVEFDLAGAFAIND